MKKNSFRNLIKRQVLMLLFVFVTFLSISQNVSNTDSINVIDSKIDNTQLSNDTLTINQKVIAFERSLEQLSKLNFIKYKEQKELREKLALSGKDLQNAKKSFFIGLSSQIVGLTSAYLINTYSPENHKTSNGIIYVSTGINFACLINTWVKIGNSGKRLSELGSN